MHQVIFVSNKAVHGGGLGNFNGATSRLSHVTFFNNSAVRGGAMSAWNGSQVSILNSIFWDNKLDTEVRPGTEEAEGIYASSSSQGGHAHLMNAIIDGGTSGSHIFVCNRCSVNDDGANSADDPLFTNGAALDGPDDLFGTDNDGLSLGMGSGALDIGLFVDAYDIDWDGDNVDTLSDFTDSGGDGDYEESIDTDLAGTARVLGPETDVGAYEYIQ